MICVSLSGITFQECINALSKSEFAEIRIDGLELTKEELKSLVLLKKKSIATCRPGKYNDLERINLLKFAILSGIGYIDIEYEADENYRKELVEFAHANSTLVIISYHNFEITPSLPELEKIIAQSNQMGADRVKIATMANTSADCSRLMSLYQNHNNLIAFGMGKKGKITRVAAPLLGAEFTYAALTSKDATAPGQLTIEEFIDAYYIID